jgi:hypothetical protein
MLFLSAFYYVALKLQISLRQRLARRKESTVRTHFGLKAVILVALAFLSIASRAEADGVTWTLVDVTSLGTTFTGSFVFDADTATYSNINITTSGGSIIPSETWSNWAGFAASEGPGIACCLAVVDTALPNQTGANMFNLIFSAFLTDAGGTVPIFETQQGTCNDAGCGSFTPYAANPGGITRDVTGYVVATTPEPGSLVLLATALLGLLSCAIGYKFLTAKLGFSSRGASLPLT